MEESIPDFPLTIRSDDEYGEWLYASLVAEYAEESEAWAVERIQRVTEQLNSVRLACPEPGACPHDLRTHILWVGAMNAFAAPGRYVYITRSLLQRFGEDAPVAFILAHEMAHHDLGHVRLLSPALSRLRNLPGNFLMAAIVKILQGQFRTREQEKAADTYALDLCIAAGYDPLLSLEALDVLEAYLLDHRALDAVFGHAFRPLNQHPPLVSRRVSLHRQLVRSYGYKTRVTI